MYRYIYIWIMISDVEDGFVMLFSQKGSVGSEEEEEGRKKSSRTSTDTDKQEEEVEEEEGEKYGDPLVPRFSNLRSLLKVCLIL